MPTPNWATTRSWRRQTRPAGRRPLRRPEPQIHRRQPSAPTQHAGKRAACMQANLAGEQCCWATACCGAWLVQRRGWGFFERHRSWRRRLITGELSEPRPIWHAKPAWPSACGHHATERYGSACGRRARPAQLHRSNTVFTSTTRPERVTWTLVPLLLTMGDAAGIGPEIIVVGLRSWRVARHRTVGRPGERPAARVLRPLAQPLALLDSPLDRSLHRPAAWS